MQRAANRAVFDGLAAYERRHGWRGHLPNVIGEVRPGELPASGLGSDPEVNGYIHAIVTETSPSGATVEFGRYSAIARRQPTPPGPSTKFRDLLKAGDIVYVKVVSLAEMERPRSTWKRTPARRAHWSRSTTPPARSRPWSADAISISRSSTAPPRRCARSGSSFKPYVYTAAIDPRRHAGRHHPRRAGHLPDAVRASYDPAQLRRKV